MLARFRDVVEQSMAHHKKKKLQPHHKQADISGPNRLLSRRLSSQIELASLIAGSVAAQTTYISELDDLNLLPEVDVKVGTSNSYSVLSLTLIATYKYLESFLFSISL